MANTKEFNLIKYVYGRLFAEQLFEKEGFGLLIEETGKIYSWQNIFKWFKKEGYLIDFEIGNVSYNTSAIAYQFNRKDLMYRDYLCGIERNMLKNSIEFVPIGDLIKKKDVKTYESHFKKSVEYIDSIDRCLGELNKKISEEILKSNKKEKQKAA